MTLTSCLTDVYKCMLTVSYYTDCCTAYDRNHSHFAGWKSECCILAFLCHELSGVTCGTYKLCALSRIKLNVVNLSTNWDVLKW